MLQILTKGQSFVDEMGRERIFNGLNMVFKGKVVEGSKELSYIPDWGEDHFRWLKDNGFNMIRLGIVWDAIEHEMGHYDEAYLDWVGRMLDLCAKYDVYAFLDMHQDLYGRPLGGGAPSWAFLADTQDHAEGALWSDAYIISEAINTAYRKFWENAKAKDGVGLQDHYANMWAHIAKRYHGHEALVGYDVLNEPFAGENSQLIFGTLLGAYAQVTGQPMTPEELMMAFGDVDRKHALLKKIDDVTLYTAMTEPAFPYIESFDLKDLAPFYNRMTTAIRQVVPDGIMMMEHSYFSNMGIPCSLPPITVDGEREPLQAYSPHAYDLVVDTPRVVDATNNRLTAILSRLKAMQDRLSIPVLMGEWGAHDRYAEGLSHIAYILGYFDRHKWSHTYWCYFDGMEQARVMGVLRRPYPQAVNGVIEAYHNDQNSDTFTLSWTEADASDLPTVVYLPHSPKAVHVDGTYRVEQLTDASDACLLMIEPESKGHRELTVQL